MELKSYQKEVIADLARYLELVVELQSPAKAYQTLWNEKNVLVGFGGMPNYVNALPGVPHVCAKVPPAAARPILPPVLCGRFLTPCPSAGPKPWCGWCPPMPF